MRTIKKSLAVLVIFALTVQGLSVSASAKKQSNTMSLKTLDEISAFLDSSPTTQKTTMNEIDYISSIQTMDDETLRQSGYSENDIKSVRSIDYNERLLDLGNKEMDELLDIGYTKRQIKDIKAYDGRTDALIYASKARLSEATVTFKYGLAGKNSTKKVMIAYDVKWNGAPRLLFTDTIVVAWFAVDSKNRNIPVRQAETPTLSVKYNDRSTGYFTKNIKVKPSKDNHIAPSFNMLEYHKKYPYYACHMGGTVVIEPKNSSANMSIIQVQVGYGHGKYPITTPQVTVTTNYPYLKFKFNSAYRVLILSYQPFHYYDWGIVTVKE